MTMKFEATDSQERCAVHCGGVARPESVHKCQDGQHQEDDRERHRHVPLDGVHEVVAKTVRTMATTPKTMATGV